MLCRVGLILILTLPAEIPNILTFPTSPSTQDLQGSKEKAAAYLEMRLRTLTNPYAVAMASYALANENKPYHKTLFKFTSPGLCMKMFKIHFDQQIFDSLEV